MEKVIVEGIGQEGVRQLSEPSFKQTCDGVDRGSSLNRPSQDLMERDRKHTFKKTLLNYCPKLFLSKCCWVAKDVIVDLFYHQLLSLYIIEIVVWFVI